MPTYDEEALAIANLAAAFRVFGIEPRHLRQYRMAVDREMGLIEQVVIPLLRQRNPEARQRALEAAEELAATGPVHTGGAAAGGAAPPPARLTAGGATPRAWRYISYMVRVLLRAVRVDLQSNTPVLLLQETEGEGRTLPIFIGSPEATAIAYALQGVTMPRPLTHDLMKDMLSALDITVERVIVTELRASTYYAEMHLVHGGERTVVSSRPSDAVAVAVRTEVPVVRLRRADGVGGHPPVD